MVESDSGVLLVNLGTPDAPRAPEVRRYLRQFLSDPRVIDLPAPARRALLELVILPTRPRRSAAAYAEIWTPEGSPLLVHGRALRDGVRELLPGVHVEIAMRYGEPSIASGLETLREAGCDAVTVLPLYPQYASSSTGSTVEEVYRLAAKLWNTPFLTVVPPFFDDPGFLDAFAAVARPVLDEFQPDRVLFSYHGVPERHVRKSDPSGSHCLASERCCDVLTSVNRMCYTAQCHATTRALVSRLGLDEAPILSAFQSRLGRTPWIRPFTDEVLPALARGGTRRLLVVCPSFVADCLETLEEIGLRAAADWRQAGGEELRLLPSLNAHPAWVRAVADLIRRGSTVPRHP